MLRVVCMLVALAGAYGAREFVPDETIKNRILADGYYTESHQVTTEDGYILEINRIPHERHQKEDSSPNVKKPVVFLMHGIITSAISFVVLGPETAIGYNLADAGYDVWMGNARGVGNSRRHVRLDPDDPNEKAEFFDYSFEQIGVIDCAAMIDYILKITDQENLHYIGHSQGGTAFLTLASVKPEYNAKIKSVHLLAGVGYQEHTPNTIITTLAERTNAIYAFTQWRGFVELDVNIKDMLPFSEEEIRSDDPSNAFTIDLQTIIRLLQRIKNYWNLPASAAMKQLAHYGQNIRDKEFRKWDYGVLRNLVKYGSRTPPNYDLSKITTNVTWHYTTRDLILDERDVLAMVQDIPNARARQVASDHFLHADFVALPEVKRLVTDYIIADLNQYYENCYYEY